LQAVHHDVSAVLASCAKILYILSMPDKKSTDIDWQDQESIATPFCIA
jgi:hypothetical protein